MAQMPTGVSGTVLLMTATVTERSMSIRPAPAQQSRRAAIHNEVVDIWDRLTGPDGNAFARSRSARFIAGTAPAAACYMLPEWARDPGHAGVPLWWIWPAASWASGDRRQELLLSASLGLAALTHETGQAARTLTLVARDGAARTDRPNARREADLRQQTLESVARARRELVDHDGSDPVLSQRPSALESLMLAAACYLLPGPMREMADAGVPQLWAWPSTSWDDQLDRADELTIGTALALAAVELYDLQQTPVVRALEVIDGGQSR
jgi:hypothetical protein